MDENIKKWCVVGGTGISFTKHSIDEIFEIIEEVIHGKKEEAKVKKQIKEMEVEPEPTEKMKESGNYKKGKINFKKMNIMIENPKGSVRWGFSDNGVKWLQKMKAHYGYITGTEGADYDPVDCFIGDKLNASKVFVVNQGKAGMFDEVKVVLGCDSIDEARELYLSNYQRGWDGIMSIIPTNTKKLRVWLQLQSKEPFK